MEGWLSVAILCHLGMGIADPDYILSVVCMLGADLYLLRTLKKLNISNRKQCGDFFLKNNRYGMMIFLSLVVTNLLVWGKSKVFREVDG